MQKKGIEEDIFNYAIAYDRMDRKLRELMGDLLRPGGIKRTGKIKMLKEADSEYNLYYGTIKGT